MSTARSVYNAPPPKEAEVPAYRVVEYSGEPIEKELCRFDEKEKIILREKRMFTEGYMVYFAKGHSNFYESIEALEKAGLGEVVPLIRANGEAEVNKDTPIPTTRRVIEKASRGE